MIKIGSIMANFSQQMSPLTLESAHLNMLKILQIELFMKLKGVY